MNVYSAPQGKKNTSTPWLAIAFHILATVIGGYFLAAISSQFLALGLAKLGMLRSEAVVASALLAFLIYLVILLWAFAERRLLRLFMVLCLFPCLLYLLADQFSR